MKFRNLGIVPEYMHGILVGVVKSLLALWFDSKNCRNDYYLGKKNLAVVSKRMDQMQPPNEIERVPSNLIKNHLSLKASEYQTFLLYYSLPCLVNVLNTPFLEHFLMLSEAVYIFLQDRITPEDLERGGQLLDLLFKLFEC